MDLQEYWAIAERGLEIQNPISAEKLAVLDTYCQLERDARVIDIGCGKAALLRRWAKAYGIKGTGLEINPAFVQAAREKAEAEGVVNRLSLIEGAALDFAVEEGRWDVAVCLGASFALGGFVPTIRWMEQTVRSGGMAIVGDLTLESRPPFSEKPKLPLPLAECIGIIERHGFAVEALVSASPEEFERYASDHHHAVTVWAEENGRHPDREEILARARADWHTYLNNRPYFGWTIFIATRNGPKDLNAPAG